MLQRFLLVIAVLMAPLASPEDPSVQGRAVFEKLQGTVVTIELVIKQKFSMMGQPSEEDESKEEITGTVIGADGLIVTALSSTDPSSIYRNMMPAGMGADFQFEVEVSDVKILTEDGKEIPASLILRDNDLDLAYIRPRDLPESPMSHVSLEDTGEAQILDRLLTINRLGKVANRVHTASFEWVEAVVDKPRRFYVPGNDPTNTASGSPAFTMDGKFVGIFVMRTIQSSSGRDNIMPIILPAADIAEGLSQVPEREVDTPAE